MSSYNFQHQHYSAYAQPEHHQSGQPSNSGHNDAYLHQYTVPQHLGEHYLDPTQDSAAFSYSEPHLQNIPAPQLYHEEPHPQLITHNIEADYSRPTPDPQAHLLPTLYPSTLTQSYEAPATLSYTEHSINGPAPGHLQGIHLPPQPDLLLQPPASSSSSSARLRIEHQEQSSLLSIDPYWAELLANPLPVSQHFTIPDLPPPPRRYPCASCGEDFSRQADLNRHQRSVCGSTEDKCRYDCPNKANGCYVTFSRKDGIRSHLSRGWCKHTQLAVTQMPNG